MHKRHSGLFVLIGIIFFALTFKLSAQEKIFASYPGFSGFQAPIWAAKDLGLLDKYGLSSEIVMLAGGARGIQALLAGSTQFCQTAATPVASAILGGGDLVMVAIGLNKFPFSIVTRKEIRKPAELVGKKIGIVNFGGSTELAVVLALKEWNIPRQSVTLIPAGEMAARLAALSSRNLDATILSPPETLKAQELGMTILADLSDIKAAFPQTTIAVRRAFLEKNRETVKRFVRAYSEGIYELRTSKENAMKVFSKRLTQKEPELVAETYRFFSPSWSFPPRLDPAGLPNALSLIPHRTLDPKLDTATDRFFDGTILSELEKEGFFSRLERRSRK
jgi:ABC-type nitrate/sulfonate/bicarbonate transport system substrate-binding protein